MNCFDCAELGTRATAIAICTDCGAALCHEHAHVVVRWLTKTVIIDRQVLVNPPARTICCGVCNTARQAAHDPHATLVG